MKNENISKTDPSIKFLLNKKISANAYMPQPNAPRVIVSFSIPEPQKKTEGIKNIAMANCKCIRGNIR